MAKNKRKLSNAIAFAAVLLGLGVAVEPAMAIPPCGMFCVQQRTVCLNNGVLTPAECETIYQECMEGCDDYSGVATPLEKALNPASDFDSPGSGNDVRMCKLIVPSSHLPQHRSS